MDNLFLAFSICAEIHNTIFLTIDTHLLIYKLYLLKKISAKVTQLQTVCYDLNSVWNFEVDNLILLYPEPAGALWQ